MNIAQLKAALEAKQVDLRRVSLDGKVRDDCLILERPESGGWCLYYSERGQRTGERWFITEEEACAYIFDTLPTRCDSQAGRC